jgi:hypothetical protein
MADVINFIGLASLSGLWAVAQKLCGDDGSAHGDREECTESVFWFCLILLPVLCIVASSIMSVSPTAGSVLSAVLALIVAVLVAIGISPVGDKATSYRT